MAESASLFPDDATSPNERNILRLLKADESTHLDQILELLEADVSRSEIFAALFELGTRRKIWPLPGKAW